jgi:hypothetical protein
MSRVGDQHIQPAEIDEHGQLRSQREDVIKAATVIMISSPSFAPLLNHAPTCCMLAIVRLRRGA